MIKYFITAILFLTCSCSSSNQPQRLSSLPTWYASPTNSDAQNLYGVGEGYNLSEASSSALNNLAGKLMTSISSESSVLLESNRYSVNEQSRQNINEEVGKITFNNYQVSKSAAFGGKIYTEISVNKNGFINDYKQKLNDLDQKMANVFKSAQSKTILEKINDLNLVSNLSLEATRISQILANLTNSSFKKNIDLYNSYQNSYLVLASKIEFFIENNGAPQSLVQKVVNILNQKQFKVVKRKNLNNSNFVIIKINSNITEQKIYGSYIAKLRADFNLISNQNKIIKSTSFENTGSSVISKKAAIDSAIYGIKDFKL
ncbi:MAG: hypothetical protein ACJAZX_001497, partial [Rickettsiales bacterium]